MIAVDTNILARFYCDRGILSRNSRLTRLSGRGFFRKRH